MRGVGRWWLRVFLVVGAALGAVGCSGDSTSPPNGSGGMDLARSPMPDSPDLAYTPPPAIDAGLSPKSARCAVSDAKVNGSPFALPDVFCDNPATRNRYVVPLPGSVRVRVRMHAIRSAAGVLSASQGAADSLIATANLFFRPTGVELVSEGPIDIIDDPMDQWDGLTTNSPAFLDLVVRNNSPRALDIYVVHNLVDACGIAGDIGFTPGYDYQVQDALCTGNTFAHEIGHLLGLFHTHHQPDDGLADTPRDPGPLSSLNEGLGWCDDPPNPACMAMCADGAMPDTRNVMSYYTCAEQPGSGHFSGEQALRLLCYLDRNSGYAIERVPNCTPMAEACDGRDNDCDGLVDEDCAACAPGTLTCGVGECRRTVPACLNGMAQNCTPGTPAPESCDGRDNDCNGLVDDMGVQSCGQGQCLRTVSLCVNGALQTCTPGAPVAEICDGKDNDCNGLVDDMGTRSCGTGECRRTVSTCLNGVLQTCTPGAPVAEICDGRDNDCNGLVDDMGTRSCGTGECRRTVSACLNGVLQTCTPGAPVAEICDGKDNDCNGLVDDGSACAVTLTRGVICGLGHTRNFPNPECEGRIISPNAANGNCPPGWGYVHWCDLGGPNGTYFFGCILNADTVRTTLPSGLLCGYGHSINQPNPTCEGMTVQKGQPNTCPAGYTYQSFGDWGANAGTGFFGCEPVKKHHRRGLARTFRLHRV